MLRYLALVAVVLSANVAGGHGDVHDAPKLIDDAPPVVQAWADHFQQHGRLLAHPHRAQAGAGARRPEFMGVVIFAAAALCTSLCMGLAADRLRSRDTEASLPTLAIYVCIPWFLATLWLFNLAVRSLVCDLGDRCGAEHSTHPPRCHWLAWYLLLAPALTALVAVCQTLALLNAHTRGAEERPMGRMFQHRSAQQAASPWSAIVAASARLPRKMPQERTLEVMLQHGALRNTLLFLEALAMVLGAGLMVSAGATCEAGLWWAAASFTMATLVVLAVSALLAFNLASETACQDDVKMQYGIVYASPPSSRESSPEQTANIRALTLAHLWKSQWP